jgi:serine/threonine protein kinase
MVPLPRVGGENPSVALAASTGLTAGSVSPVPAPSGSIPRDVASAAKVCMARPRGRYCVCTRGIRGTAVASRVGTAFGKYNITRLLGKGGMGEVYEAYDTGKGRIVALKILADEFSNDVNFRTRFQRESHAAAILQEPHVIPIHDWGEIDGSLYIDMRLVHGQTLFDLIAKGPLAPSRAVAIISQVGAALDAAHAERLIHRDIKPQNIIVTPNDFAYLVDFGIAEATGDTRLTMAGTQIGTMIYMAPERFSDQVATPAVDVYSLACVLYESLTGDAPFATDSLENLLAAHMGSPPPRPSVANPRVPAALDDVVARGMAKDPDDRYGTAGGLGRAAQRALQTGEHDLANAMTVAPPGVSSPTAAGAPSPFGGRGPSAHAGTTVAPPSGAAPAGPTALPPERDSGQRTRGWVLPTVIAVASALILGGIGVVIGLVAHRNSDQAAGPSPSTVNRTAEPTSVEGGSPQTPPQQSLSTPPPRVARPPLVTGPDESSLHQSCDQGFTLPTGSGFGTHAGRGTPETSCLFTSGVLTSYWAEYGNASPLPRGVSAPGAVDCSSVAGALCNGSNFLMQCQQYAGDGWITCTGGSNARVYLW